METNNVIGPPINVIPYKYIPGEVYNNLYSFLKYRGVSVKSKIVPEGKISQTLSHHEYIMIEGVSTRYFTKDNPYKEASQKSSKTEKEKHEDIMDYQLVYVLLIAPDSKYANHTQDFKKLLNFIPKASLETSNIIIVSKDGLTSPIKKYYVELQLTHYPNAYLEEYSYMLFQLVVPEHILVPKHTIMSDAEVKILCDERYFSKEDLPKMLVIDTMAVWIGARPGNIVRIERYSESVGFSMGYRIVVKAQVDKYEE